MDIRVKTKDNKIVKISENFYKDSEYLKYMSELLNDGCDSEEENNEININIPNISSKDLDTVISAYNDVSINNYNNIKDIVIIINISNFLNINDLFLKSIEQIRNIIRNKTTDELRVLFKETNDFTEENYTHIRKKDEWCKKWDCYDNSNLIKNLY